jgi:ribonucleoside-diphosphate reductase beta chain
MSLFSAFAMLLNYQRQGKMKGMCEVVEWSIKDESLHVVGMSRLFREFCNEHPRVVNDEFKKEIYEMFRVAVSLEDKVIDLAYEMGSVEGLDKGEVKAYIRHLADRRLIMLGLKPNYGIKDNPLPWVEWIVAGDSFKNFFEGTVTDYSAAGMTGEFWNE